MEYKNLDQKIVIFVGDVTDDLATHAKTIYPDASLITQDNCINIKHGVYYLSLGDFNTLLSFIQTLEQSDIIIYQPPSNWSDFKNNYSYMQQWTEFYLAYFSREKHVVNIDQIWDTQIGLMSELVAQRKTQSTQIWNVGCSISHGVGISQEQRYGQLIANKLKLPISFLTRGGSSIPWAANQILRSDIKENDLVIWGLTSYNRFSYFKDEIKHVTANSYIKNKELNKIFPIDQLDHPTMLYNSVISILEVVNYCSKINAQLIIAGLLVNPTFIKFTNVIPNYLQFYGAWGQDDSELYIDLGDDNSHPGPLTHQYYAEKILNIL